LKAKFAAQDDELKKLRREIEEMRMKSAAGGLDEAVARAVEVKGVKVLTHRADGLERGQLRTLVDNLKQKLGEGVVVLGSAQPEGKVAMIAGRDAGADEAHPSREIGGRGGEDCGRIGRREAGDCRGRRQGSGAD
jgi:alanyl-tRNA synthetase